MRRFGLFMLMVSVLGPGVFAYEYYYVKSGAAFSTPTEQITTLTGGNWDDGYYDLAISTAFFFYGRKVTHIRIWTNGYITLGFGSAPTDSAVPENQPIPSADVPNGLIAPWWDDWDLTSGGSIWYITNYVHTAVEWRGVAHKNDPTARYNFQLLLYSSLYQWLPMAIIFHYIDADSGTGEYDYGKSGTIGFEHWTGYQGEQIGYLEAKAETGKAFYCFPYVPIYDTTAFYGTGKPDLTVYRPSEGRWYYLKNDGSQAGSFRWGDKGDIPLPGDFDGDGDADFCVYRPQTCLWYCYEPSFCIQWGEHGDIPMVADFNGDGKSDIAVYRPWYGLWFIYYPTLLTSEVVQWGTRGDIPLPADYDGDGKADCAVFRTLENTWYIRKSSNPGSSWVVAWGTDGDIPLPTKNHGANYANIAVFRPSTGQWFTYNQASGTSSTRQWGAEQDLPTPNDWDGSGYSDYVVFRPSDGRWYIKYDSGTSSTSIGWGTLNDKPRCRRSATIIAPPQQK